MPSHKEEKNLPYTAQQMLDLVIDIEQYPKFLPWCSAAKITKKINNNNMDADLVINFKTFSQKYSSNIRIHKLNKDTYEIFVASTNGPFKKLVNYWKFQNIDKKQNLVKIIFFIDFEFNSRIFEKMIGFIFKKATDRMIDAFEKRAIELYG